MKEHILPRLKKSKGSPSEDRSYLFQIFRSHMQLINLQITCINYVSVDLGKCTIRKILQTNRKLVNHSEATDLREWTPVWKKGGIVAGSIESITCMASEIQNCHVPWIRATCMSFREVDHISFIKQLHSYLFLSLCTCWCLFISCRLLYASIVICILAIEMLFCCVHQF